MELRAYQLECIAKVSDDFLQGHKKLLAVVPTGGGKTIIFSNLSKSVLPRRTLILAHREELIDQAIGKLYQATGIIAGKEKAEWKARLTDDVVVASLQSLQGKRLFRWPQNHFDLVVIDETHHVLANSYQRVLQHFAEARVLGVTATPDRGDKKNLGQFFEKISFQISILDLINQGFLVPIVTRTIPLRLDLAGVKSVAGDFDAAGLDASLNPMLPMIAKAIAEHAMFRRTLVFVPLIATSHKMVEACQSYGLRACHIDGSSPDRAEILARYAAGQIDVLVNAMLLTEGFDDPGIDCLVVLRPTRSESLYRQMIGRGLRLAQGKTDLLVLDFLWHHETHSLVRPASLIANTEAHADAITERLVEAAEKELESGGYAQTEMNLMDVSAAVETETQIAREKKLAAEIAKQRRKAEGTLDPIAFAMSLDTPGIADFQPSNEYEASSVSDRQAKILKDNGIDPGGVTSRGQASKIIDVLIARAVSKLATPKQMNFLKRHGHKSPVTATFEEASAFIGSRISGRKYTFGSSK